MLLLPHCWADPLGLRLVGTGFFYLLKVERRCFCPIGGQTFRVFRKLLEGFSTHWLADLSGLPVIVTGFFYLLKFDDAAFAVLSGRPFGSSTSRYTGLPLLDV